MRSHCKTVRLYTLTKKLTSEKDLGIANQDVQLKNVDSQWTRYVCAILNMLCRNLILNVTLESSLQRNRKSTYFNKAPSLFHDISSVVFVVPLNPTVAV